MINNLYLQTLAACIAWVSSHFIAQLHSIAQTAKDFADLGTAFLVAVAVLGWLRRYYKAWQKKRLEKRIEEEQPTIVKLPDTAKKD